MEEERSVAPPDNESLSPSSVLLSVTLLLLLPLLSSYRRATAESRGMKELLLRVGAARFKGRCRQRLVAVNARPRGSGNPGARDAWWQ